MPAFLERRGNRLLGCLGIVPCRERADAFHQIEAKLSVALSSSGKACGVGASRRTPRADDDARDLFVKCIDHRSHGSRERACWVDSSCRAWRTRRLSYGDQRVGPAIAILLIELRLTWRSRSYNPGVVDPTDPTACRSLQVFDSVLMKCWLLWAQEGWARFTEPATASSAEKWR